MADQRPRKRFDRVQLACIPCRQGKLKCNRAYPTCDQCHRRVRESECAYTERGLRYNTDSQKAKALREKLDRLEDFVSQLKHVRPEPAINQRNPTCEVKNETDGALTNSFGNLKISESGGTQYFGPSHWESIIDDIADVKTFFDQGDSPESDGNVDAYDAVQSDILPADILFSISRTYSREDLICRLPQKSDLDRWLATWFTTPDSLRFIIHGPTFQQEYSRFWQAQEDFSPVWLALFLTLASLGAEISAQTRQCAATLVQAEDLRRLAAHAIVLSDYTKPQPYLIETLLLYTKSLMIQCHSMNNQIWIMLGLVTRLSTLAGYHRDPSLNPAITKFAGEMRRRVWSAIREYDIIMCYAFGMTSMINHQGSDTRLPANLSDSDLSPTFVPPGKPFTEHTPMTFEICYSKLTFIYGDAIYCSHVLTNPTAAEIEELDARLEQAREELPPFLQMAPMDQCFLDSAEHMLNRYRLALQYTKGLCILYRRYLGTAGHAMEQQRCLDAAEQHAKYHEVLIEATHSGGRFEYYKVLIARHAHDFTFVALLLSAEIKRRSEKSKTIENDQWVERITKSLARGGSLWQGFGIKSTKLRVAVSAILQFLQQHAGNPASPTRSPSDGALEYKPSVTYLMAEPFYAQAPVTVDEVSSQYVGEQGPLPIGQSATYWPTGPIDNNTISFTTAQMEAFDTDDTSKLFQDLFGPDYMGHEDHGVQWA